MAACPGCVGRGTGPVCAICGGDVPAGKRRTQQSKPEYDTQCLRCRASRPHTH